MVGLATYAGLIRFSLPLLKATSGGGWTPPSRCPRPSVGAELSVRNCSRNGLFAEDGGGQWM